MKKSIYQPSPDLMLSNDNWSDLSQYQQKPEIDSDRLRVYRMGRIKAGMREADVALCVLVNPISLRYAVEYRNFSLFQSHIPTIYLFLPAEGPGVIHGTSHRH